ncbi:MAG TPA: cyanophycin synthetase, partial [Syntrophorhabdaceae bacterium]|nr:cyanophycin synthetase [Syntrophorhabdaceae bacterium]
EIKATLLSLRNMCKGRIIVAFQPHRYTRTKALMEEFVTSFNEADVLLITEIYPASEEPIEGISGAMLAEKIKSSGHKFVIYCPTKEEVADKITEIASNGDTVVVLGAGDINKICDVLKQRWTGQV